MCRGKTQTFKARARESRSENRPLFAHPLSVALALLLLSTGCLHRHAPVAASRRPPAPSPTPVKTPAPIVQGEEGIASWYGYPYHGRPTSSGEIYNMYAISAAHRTLP